MIRYLVLILSLFIATPAYATQPWTITKGKEVVSLFEMPKDGNTYQLSRIYYDAANKRFLIDMLAGPAETVNISGRKGLLVLDPNTKKSFWAAQRPNNLSTAQNFFPLPPAGTEMFMNSALTRVLGAQNFTQPFGNYESVIRSSEQKYTTQTTLKNYNHPGQLLTKTFGNGEITWTIRDGARTPVFVLKETYTENSHDYAGFWTPDGLYFFMVMPDNVFLTMGPFPTDVMDIMLKSRMEDERDNVRDEIKLDDRMLAGDIGSDEHYGLPYIHMINRIANCGELQALTGKVTDLTLHPPGSLQTFGFPYPGGKRMVFDFKAEKENGQLKANIITYMKEDEGFSKYKEWLQVVTVIDKTGTTYIGCP